MEEDTAAWVSPAVPENDKLNTEIARANASFLIFFSPYSL